MNCLMPDFFINSLDKANYSEFEYGALFLNHLEYFDNFWHAYVCWQDLTNEIVQCLISY